eukprot:COSAG02_NODE_30249_length_554_cov_9.439510_1_plen_46_part_01
MHNYAIRIMWAAPSLPSINILDATISRYSEYLKYEHTSAGVYLKGM